MGKATANHTPKLRRRQLSALRTKRGAADPSIALGLRYLAAWTDYCRHPLRDRVMILLSVKSGLRAKQISCLTWAMVTDAEGAIGDAIHLTNGASKGKGGGRTIPLNTTLREALVALKSNRAEKAAPHRHVAGKLGFTGASSHSGRRQLAQLRLQN